MPPVNERIDMLAQDAEEVIELQLDNCNSGGAIADVNISEKFTRLKRLHLCNSNLRKLDKFPALPSLRRLELADNRLDGGLENLLSLPSLKTLNLAGNRIKDLKTLEPLKELEELTTLDLLENPVCTSDSGYPDAIFDLLPQLVYLDETDREGNPMNEDEDEDDGDERELGSDEDLDEYEEDDLDEIVEDENADASELGLLDEEDEGEALFDNLDGEIDADEQIDDDNDDDDDDADSRERSKRTHEDDAADDLGESDGREKRLKSDRSDSNEIGFVDDELDDIEEAPL
eukprot:m.81458 g.81458  ORF g.81458 m.81458 type:complete len:288 (-) comp11004_c0_seq3:1646-2509(-)